MPPGHREPTSTLDVGFDAHHPWADVLTRTLCYCGAFYVGMAAMVMVWALVRDEPTRGYPGVWLQLASQLTIIGLYLYKARQTGPNAGLAALGIAVATVGLVGAHTVEWGVGPEVAPVVEATLPVIAIQCFQSVCWALILRLSWTIIIGLAAVPLCMLLDQPGMVVVDETVLAMSLVPTGVFLAAAIIADAARRGLEQAGGTLGQRIAVRADEADELNAQFADDEGRRLIHDRVIGALRVIQDGEPGERMERAAQAALDVLADVDPVASALSLGQLLESSSDIHVTVSRHAWDIAPPPRVETAFRSAAQEAIRNASRHSGVDEVSVVMATSRVGQAMVVVRDEGVGFDVDAAHGFGTTQSIVERMRQVGGDALISSRVGGGTTVRLMWPAPSATPLERPANPLGQSQRSRLYAVAVTPPAAIAFYYGLQSVGASRVPGVTLVATLAFILTAYACAYVVGQRRPSWGVVAGLAVAHAAVTLEALANTAPDGLQMRASWIVGTGGLALAIVGVEARLRHAFGLVAIIAGVVVGFQTSPYPVEPVGALACTIGASVAGYVFGALLRRMTRVAEFEEALALAKTEESGWRESMRDAHRRYANQLLDDVAPFLRRVAADGSAVTADMRTMASALAAQCRDLLAQADPMPSTLRSAVLAARLRGQVVSIRDATTVTPEAWRLLETVLHHCPDVDAVTLLPTRAEVPARVTAIPRLGPDVAAAIIADLEPLPIVTNTSAVSTTFDVLSPKSATSPAVGEPIGSTS